MPPQLDVNPFVSGATPATDRQPSLAPCAALPKPTAALSDADARALAAASLYMFGQTQPLDAAAADAGSRRLRSRAAI